MRRRGSDEGEPRSPFENIDLYRDYTSVKRQGSDNGEQRSPVNAPLKTFDKAGENGPGSPQVGHKRVMQFTCGSLTVRF